MFLRRAFTNIVQLLVVSVVFSALLASLWPVMDKMEESSRRARCASNLQAAGVAVGLALNDSPARAYPPVPDWWVALGNLGIQGVGQGDPNRFDVQHRVLNKYMGYTKPRSKVPQAECPADKGDVFTNANVYLVMGTSYVTTMGVHFGIKGVFNPPVKFADIQSVRSVANKIVLSDTPIYGNRWLDYKPDPPPPPPAPPGQPQPKPPPPQPKVLDLRHRWHTTERKRLLNTLFADSHVELFDYDPGDEKLVGPDGKRLEHYPDNGRADHTRRYW